MYDFKKTEQDVYDYWEKNDIYAKAKKKSSKGKKFYFLDGPPYTSGRVHLGTAWNKSLKDAALRYKRMQGFNVWDRAGYDMHGMPTERAVEKKFNLKNKDEIPNFGVEKFINECKKFSIENMHLMSKDFKKLGVWMDFDNAYQSIKKDFIEGVWWLVKKAHENKRLYEGRMSITWCKDCATALAKHELEYENVSDDSIFVKFKVANKENEYLIIWTTTPWTIPYNLAVMANPDFEYVKAKVGDEVWILARGLANTMIRAVAEKDYEIQDTIMGSELEGVKYIHPFYDKLKQVYDPIIKESKKAFTVLMSSEYVDLSAGTGLVHTAPGCGPEDFEVGHRNGIPAFNNLTEFGVFPEEMGEFAGKIAKDNDKDFIKALEDVGALIASTQVDHDYAHCWRCKQPVIYRTTKQWFFKIEDLKEKMRKLNKEIFWIPDNAGSRNFDSWLANLRDNGITRQRYWGTPFPVWKCESCEHYEVIGSGKDIEKLGGKVPDDLHKPWIDEVELNCKCGAKMKRIPDIMDVWIDAGSTSWNCLDYPREQKDFKELFPADFILEGVDQIRGWFNMLFVASMVSMQKPSFKACYMHGFINDSQGRKMSKSLGNYILPEEVLEKYGADTLRYYMIGATNPGLDLNYNFDDMKVKFRNLGVLWNLQNFLINSAKQLEINPAELKPKKFDIEEKYILSKLNSAITKQTELFDAYELSQTPWVVEELYLDLSRTYIQLTRDKLSMGTKEQKELVLYTVYKVLFESLKLFAPISPYMSEQIYLNFKEAFNLKEESVHLLDWPKPDKKSIDAKLEDEFEIIKTLIQKILSGREKLSMGVRWPLPSVTIVTEDKDTLSAIKSLGEIIKTQTNIKEIKIEKKFDAKLNIKADFKKIGPDFGDLSAKVIAHLSMTSAETILNHIEKEGQYEFTDSGAKLAVKREHLIVEKLAPEGYTYVDFNKGDIFVHGVLDAELEAEGFSRELTRRVQSLRKKSCLQKQDNIDLYVYAGKELVNMFKKHSVMIAGKVGAPNLKISELKPEKNYEHKDVFKVRGKEFQIFLNKI